MDSVIEKYITPEMSETPHLPETLRSNWVGYFYSFGKVSTSPIPLVIETKYRGVKKNLEPMVRETTIQHNIIMKFCPMCGVEY
jgi:hypothetical protein